MPDPTSLATPDIAPSASPGAVSAARPVSLAGLRSEIDRIDTAMHELLMERGQVIGQLIEVKKTQVSGSAFRPGREAEMMRRLALRHKGLLPLDTAEGIWRVIIATFTWRRTGSAVPGALICGLLVTWYVVAGTATQVL
jgi:chorismate mutase